MHRRVFVSSSLPVRRAVAVTVAMSQRRAFCASLATTPLLLQGYSGGSKSSIGNKKKSFDERADGRIRKSKDERRSKEEQLEEVKQYVDVELGDTIVKAMDGFMKKCENVALALKSMPTALERLKVDTGGGKERPMLQCGTFARTGPGELTFTPSVPNVTNSILLRVAKFDPEVSPTKTSDGNIRMVIPKLTRSRREKVCAEMVSIEGDGILWLKHNRTLALNTIKQICDKLDSQNESLFGQEIDGKVRASEEEMKRSIAGMVREVMTTVVEEVDPGEE